MTRRGFALLGIAGLAVAAGASAHWFNIFAESTGAASIAVDEAHARAREGRLLLVDIRRPEEWARTGVGEGALPIDMRRADFEAALLSAAGGDRTRPVALICARGVRSRAMVARLGRAGFTAVLDVPEGMLGSGAGPGWLGRGLPLVSAP